MKTKVLFSVISVGNYGYPRYAIIDCRKRYRMLRFWRGKKESPWTNDVTKAMKWADYALAGLAVADIGRFEYQHVKEQKFTLNIDVSLVGATSVTQDEVVAYLTRALSLQMDYNEQGMGPVDPTTGELKGLIFVSVKPDTLQETKSQGVK